MLATLTIPIQLMCQLVTPGNIEIGNNTFVAGGSVLKQTMDLPEGFTAFPEFEMAYKFFNLELSWNEARKTCMAYDSNLAVIDSYKKCNAIHTLRANPNLGAYVGIHKLFGNGEWLSIKTGLPVAVMPWVTDADRSNTAKDCVILRTHGEGLLEVPCSNTQNFFCEIPLLNSE